MPSSSKTVSAIPIGPTLTRAALVIVLAGALSACASHSSYRRGDYTPPGPASDPWGPYIREASTRFQVPEQWVRAVMRQESGGRQYGSGGNLTTSSAGAMGLMQVMPETYDTLRWRYDLGDDPYHPHNNILAGTAYIREMYDKYGSPAFLAAYNAGPRRLERYLAGTTELPTETVNYLASVGPRLGTSVAPTGPLAFYAGGSGGGASRVQLAALPPARTRAGGRGGAPVVMARMEPIASPGDPGMPLPAAPVAVARMEPIASPGDPGMPLPAAAPVAVARMEPVASPGDPGMPMPVQQVAAIEPAPASRSGGFSLISPTAAATMPPAYRSLGSPGGGRGVQVGAYALPAQARAAAAGALAAAGPAAGAGQATVGQTTKPDGSVLYRARVTGLTGASADDACRRVRAAGRDCIIVPPQGAS